MKKMSQPIDPLKMSDQEIKNFAKKLATFAGALRTELIKEGVSNEAADKMTNEVVQSGSCYIFGYHDV
jgi:hypothetical protein